MSHAVNLVRVAFAATLAICASADAQLFRAYLSASGSDASACTLPAPCRLLPAALNAVASGGEIWMLDSANYNAGTVNIAKSVSILAVPGVVGSLVATGGPAIEVSTPIISETSYITLLSSKSNAIQEQANISKLINLTINFFADGFRTLYDYVNFLQEAIEAVEDESQAVVSDELNSVKIMTIHQAKGLEFPIVFLYRCGEASRKTIVKTKSILINKEFGLLTKVPVNEDFFSEYQAAPIVKLNDFIADRKNTAEIKRLFYVAITRAKNQLFVSSSLTAASIIGTSGTSVLIWRDGGSSKCRHVAQATRRRSATNRGLQSACGSRTRFDRTPRSHGAKAVPGLRRHG